LESANNRRNANRRRRDGPNRDKKRGEEPFPRQHSQGRLDDRPFAREFSAQPRWKILERKTLDQEQREQITEVRWADPGRRQIPGGCHQ